MRQSSRTTKRRNILPILYSSRLTTTTSSPTSTSPKHRNPFNTYHPIRTTTNRPQLLRRQTLMSRVLNCLLSKNAPIRHSPMTTKSSCRSSSCRINSTSSSFTKIRGIRHNTSNSYPKPHNKRSDIPIYYPSPLRCINNGRYLPSTIRYKIFNRLLIC